MKRAKMWAGIVSGAVAAAAVFVTACVSQGEYDSSVDRTAAATASNEQRGMDELRSLNDSGYGFSGSTHSIISGDKIASGSAGLRASTMAPRPGRFNLGNPAPLQPPTCSTQEELWVICRVATTVEVPDDNLTPRGGMLVTCPPGDTREVAVPLKHTDVKASVTGYISSVDVTQRFHNPYTSKIEAVYAFPLPENAGVSEFVMTVGDRKIRGIVREREEAERIYVQARAQGHAASLLSQERPNIFTQRVANIEPGKSIDVSIRYFGTLAYADGWYQFVFPMVVGPRFNPPGTTDGIGVVARSDAGASGQKTEVQYLTPGERSGHDISLAVDVDAGVSIEEIRCRSHAVEIDRRDTDRARVRIATSESIPNRDFVLSWRVAGDKVKSGLITHKTDRGGFFTLMLIPPKDVESLERSPMEMVFVIDRSGSMKDRPIEQAKEATARGLKRLKAGDTFQVIDFSSNASQFGSYAIDANTDNIERGLRYVDSLDASGGTMMLRGLRAALDFPHDPQRLRVVAFLTDGYIGNEKEILGALHERLGSTRVFSFGVGSSVNRYLLDSMAKMGRGAAAYVAAGDPAAETMDLFFDRVSHPAIKDVDIDWSSNRVSEVYPSRLPDLFVGRPVILTGRFEGSFTEGVRVRGRTGRAQVEMSIQPNRAVAAAAPALPIVWARTKIADLSDRATWDADGTIPGRVRQVALDFGILSQFTSFVAVDSLTRTQGEYGTTVGVPVPVPQGVRYDTTVEGEGAREQVRR